MEFGRSSAPYGVVTTSEVKTPVGRLLLSYNDRLSLLQYSASKAGTACEVAATESDTTVIGRVCCETYPEKLHMERIILETKEKRFHVDVSALRSISLFPGQIVVVRGYSVSAKGIVATSIAKPSLASPLSHVPALHLRVGNVTRPLTIWVAAGPYTTLANLDYAPLHNLLEAVKTCVPHVLVLCGPFVDAKHPAVAGNDLTVSDERATMRVDVHTLFVTQFSWKLSALLENNKLATKVVIVPATSDACSERTYPQPSMTDRTSVTPANSSWDDDTPVGALELPSCVASLSNPGMFQVNDIRIGVSSTDILFDLSHEELFFSRDSTCTPGSRVVRLASHLIDQRSFYPLFPPPMAIDLCNYEQLTMSLVPDLLLLPSKLAPFAQRVASTVVINPGHLTRGMTEGTIAKVSVDTPMLTSNSSHDTIADVTRVAVDHV